MDLSSPAVHCSSGQFSATGDWTHSKRRLDTHVMLIVQQGTLYIRQGEQEFELGPGNAMLLFASDEHAGYRSSPAGLKYFWCHFSLPWDSWQLMEEAEAEQGMRAQVQQAKQGQPSSTAYCVEVLRAANANRMVVLMKQLFQVSASGLYVANAADLSLSSLIAEYARESILAFTAKELGNSQGLDDSAGRFAEVVEWIRVHRFEPITAAQVAQQFDYNAVYFSRIFKKQAGMSLSRYIHSVKLEEACKKLLCSDASIHQIASELSYFDDKYFIRLFKQYKGLSPGKFRSANYRMHTNNH